MNKFQPDSFRIMLEIIIYLQSAESKELNVLLSSDLLNCYSCDDDDAALQSEMENKDYEDELRIPTLCLF